MCDSGQANARIAARLPERKQIWTCCFKCLHRTRTFFRHIPAVKTAKTGLPVVVLSYVIDLVNTFHSGDARATRTVKSRGHSSVNAKLTPATVTAARTGQIHPADLASRRVVTGKAASILFL